KRKIRSPKMSNAEHEKKTSKYRTALAKKQRTAINKKNIKDLLLQKPKPRTMVVTDGPKLAIPAGVSILRCMDARSCRVFALTKRTRGLPVFSALDEPEPFNPDLISKYHFVYVDAGIKIFAREPYTGPRWYAAEVVEYMLEIFVIELQHCIAGLQSTRSIPADQVAKHFQDIQDCWEETMAYQDSYIYHQKETHYKKASILSLIGLWNSTEQHSWRVVTSTHEIDAGSNVRRKRDMGDGVFQFFSSTELISLFSMAPWGRITLDVEQMRISQAIRELQRHHEISIVGAQVDGVYFTTMSWEVMALEDELLAAYKFQDGQPIFQIKKEPVSKVPLWSQSDALRAQKLTFEKHAWVEYREQDFYDEAAEERVKTAGLVQALAELFLQHGGLLLSGPAGVGKTFLMNALLKKLQELCPKDKQIISALRHCAAMLVGGKTIMHYLCKYRTAGGAPKRGSIVIVDECSEPQLPIWIELAHWKQMGVRFIILGDFKGQLKPIFDRWQDAMAKNDIAQSQLLHEM
ncbi:MAG: hypothetical protein EBZ36_15640, partial [Acidobacteria bacterium]|nr:hypothetical protein [Acidobacteriota bacterium]